MRLPGYFLENAVGQGISKIHGSIKVGRQVTKERLAIVGAFAGYLYTIINLCIIGMEGQVVTWSDKQGIDGASAMYRIIIIEE